MTECWSEGELRAYLDRELPPADVERAAAHLRECVRCERALEEVAGRAARVGALVGELTIGGRPLPRRARPMRRRWVAAALALAAGLAIAAAMLPRRTAPHAPAAPPSPVAEAGQIAAVQPAVPPAAVAERPAPVRKAAPRRRPVVRNDGFVRLDDEPFEAGMVLRVALGPGEVPADVIFGPDGRAHAIRLVNFK